MQQQRPSRWSIHLAIGWVCLAFFYAGHSVGRMPYDLADPVEPAWIPMARVVVFCGGCWWPLQWLRREIRMRS
jgi:hypothetical protein